MLGMLSAHRTSVVRTFILKLSLSFASLSSCRPCIENAVVEGANDK